MSFSKRLLACLPLLLPCWSLFVACSDDSDDDDQPAVSADCEAIGEVCTHDVPGALAVDCHEVAHANDATECARRKDECVYFCSMDPGAGGTGGSAASPDCEAIGAVCTDDVPGALAADCHEVAHANDAADCTRRKDECVDYCSTPQGMGGAAGGGGAPTGSLADCEAIGAVCTHAVPGELAADCHEVSHNNDPVECSERKDECVEHCSTGQGEGGAGGAQH